MGGVFNQIAAIFEAGGWVMWPLLAMSVISITLCVERLWWWVSQRRASTWVRQLADYLRKGDGEAARAFLSSDRSVYAGLVRGLLDRGVSEAAAVELIETIRRPVERFNAALSTIITAAPMLGILGTVTGIIDSFRLLGGDAGASGPVSDPSLVAGGIAEALVTTAFGLIVATVTLFPYMAIRAAGERALGRLEALSAASMHGWNHDAGAGSGSNARSAGAKADAA